jgi:hypothetical protein
MLRCFRQQCRATVSNGGSKFYDLGFVHILARNDSDGYFHVESWFDDYSGNTDDQDIDI